MFSSQSEQKQPFFGIHYDLYLRNYLTVNSTDTREITVGTNPNALMW